MADASCLLLHPLLRLLCQIDQRHVGAGEQRKKITSKHGNLLVVVRRQPIERLLLGARGKQDEDAALRFHARKAAGPTQSARSSPRKRIVAARVENGDDGARTFGAQTIDDVGGVEGLILDQARLALTGGRHVDGSNQFCPSISKPCPAK